MKFIKTLGSLGFALFLIASLALILSTSTIYESLRGTPAAQENFYRAHWFDAFLSLVFINIFCSTLTRWPFKKKHIGFVVTHIGILMLLAGSLLTRLYGAEGQMTLFEDEAKNHILQDGFVLRVSGPGKEEKRFDIRPKPLKRPFEVSGLRVTRLWPHALETKQIEETVGPSNVAVEAELSSEMIGMKQKVLLIEKDPFDPSSASKKLGPATFKLETFPSDAKKDTALLRIHQRSSGETLEIPAEMIKDTHWKETGLTVQVLRYYSRARVESGKLVDAPSGHPNPAVELEVSDSAGRREHHTKFTLFPDFNSLRGGEASDLFGLDVTLQLPALTADEEPTPAFIFSISPEGKWSYRTRSSKDPDGENKPLSAGAKVPTGWMDMQLEVKRLFNNAKVTKSVIEDPDKRSETPALEVDGHWLIAGRSLMLDGKRVTAEPKSTAMPFSLWLKDFRKIDYPGTLNAASYESDVVLTDTTARVTIERTIQMNKPLDYKGWRIFQASFIQDETLGEASVFSIAKNPGIKLIYPGAALIFVGVILLFYLHPFFTGEKEAPKKKATKK